MSTPPPAHIVATPIREYLEATMRRSEAEEDAEKLTDRIEKLLIFHGYSIVPTSEVDSLNAFRWKTLQNLAAAAEGEKS